MKILAGTKLEVLIRAYRNLEVFGRLQHQLHKERQRINLLYAFHSNPLKWRFKAINLGVNEIMKAL